MNQSVQIISEDALYLEYINFTNQLFKHCSSAIKWKSICGIHTTRNLKICYTPYHASYKYGFKDWPKALHMTKGHFDKSKRLHMQLYYPYWLNKGFFPKPIHMTTLPFPSQPLLHHFPNTHIHTCMHTDTHISNTQMRTHTHTYPKHRCTHTPIRTHTHHTPHTHTHHTHIPHTHHTHTPHTHTTHTTHTHHTHTTHTHTTHTHTTHTHHTHTHTTHTPHTHTPHTHHTHTPHTCTYQLQSLRDACSKCIILIVCIFQAHTGVHSKSSCLSVVDSILVSPNNGHCGWEKNCMTCQYSLWACKQSKLLIWPNLLRFQCKFLMIMYWCICFSAWVRPS